MKFMNFAATLLGLRSEYVLLSPPDPSCTPQNSSMRSGLLASSTCRCALGAERSTDLLVKSRICQRVGHGQEMASRAQEASFRTPNPQLVLCYAGAGGHAHSLRAQRALAHHGEHARDHAESDSHATVCSSDQFSIVSAPKPSEK